MDADAGGRPAIQPGRRGLAAGRHRPGAPGPRQRHPGARRGLAVLGDGKTMLAANLTHSLTRQGRAIVLASSDLHHLQVEKLLGLGQLPGLAEGAPGRPAAGDRSARIINDHLLVLPAGMPSKHP